MNHLTIHITEKNIAQLQNKNMKSGTSYVLLKAAHHHKTEYHIKMNDYNNANTGYVHSIVHCELASSKDLIFGSDEK